MQIWLKRVGLAALALIGIGLLIRHYGTVVGFLRDADQVAAWLETLGPWGPLGLIALNAIQVVVAPVPGYLVQVAAGYLFGWLPGAVYGALGMITGGAIAMFLARVYGRPLVQRLVGAARLQRWEQVTRVHSLPIWFVVMLGPFGDIPYFVAGLTQLAIWKIVAIALFVRGPSVLVAAAVGAGVVSWRSPWVIGGAIFLVSLAMAGMANQQRIEEWVDNWLLPRVLIWRDRDNQVDEQHQSTSGES